MLNPDGVIVGNYRCSLQARDLNRNYRHPRRDNFPTVFNVKRLVENLAETVGVSKAILVLSFQYIITNLKLCLFQNIVSITTINESSISMDWNLIAI